MSDEITPEAAEVDETVPEPVSAAPHTETAVAAKGLVTPGPAPRPHSTATVIAIASLIALIVATVVGLAAGFVGAHLVENGTVSIRPSNIKVVPSETDEPIVAAAAAALPSVVNIDVSSAETSTEGLPQSHPGVPMQGNGSGVAFKAAGGSGTYIITNAHVVEDADRIVVRDSSGASTKATLVGVDVETDIAVVKVDISLPLIALGDSKKLLVGQSVVAIGSPFGLEHSVSAGVVSALGRSLPASDGTDDGVYPLVDVIQTDAPINPGNSGGALVDREGRLVGINTAIYTDTGASGGVGFAIPVATVSRVAGQLIDKKSVTHPFLGVIGTDVTSSLISEKKLKGVEEGAYVDQVAAGSTAKSAGVKSGDVIIALNGDPVRSMDDLILLVRRTSVGDSVTLTIVRAGKEIELKTKVGDKPDSFKLDNTVPGSKDSTLPPNHP